MRQWPIFLVVNTCCETLSWAHDLLLTGNTNRLLVLASLRPAWLKLDGYSEQGMLREFHKTTIKGPGVCSIVRIDLEKNRSQKSRNPSMGYLLVQMDWLEWMKLDYYWLINSR